MRIPSNSTVEKKFLKRTKLVLKDFKKTKKTKSWREQLREGTKSLSFSDSLRLRVLSKQFEGDGFPVFPRLVQAGRFMVRLARKLS